MSSTPNDEFFDELSSLWKSQELTFELDVKQAKSLKRKRQWFFALDAAQGVIMLIFGTYFLLAFSDFLITFSAAFLIISALTVLIYSLKIHSKAIKYHDWSTEGVLKYRHITHVTTIKQLRMQQFGCFAIIVFTVFLALFSYIGESQLLSAKLLNVYLWICPALLLVAYLMQGKISKVKQQVKQTENALNEFNTSHVD